MSDTNDLTEQLPTVSDTDDKFMGQVPFGSMHYAKAAFGGAVVLQCHAQRYHICRYRQFADAVGTSEVHEFHQR